MQRRRPLDVAAVAPYESPLSLKYVGPWIQAQLQRGGIRTLGDLIEYASLADTQDEVALWIQGMVGNFRPGACVGRSGAYGQPNRYLVRPFNKFAYNALVAWMDHWWNDERRFYRIGRLRTRRDKVPRPMGDRTTVEAFPPACAPPGGPAPPPPPPPPSPPAPPPAGEVPEYGWGDAGDWEDADQDWERPPPPPAPPAEEEERAVRAIAEGDAERARGEITERRRDIIANAARALVRSWRVERPEILARMDAEGKEGKEGKEARFREWFESIRPRYPPPPWWDTSPRDQMYSAAPRASAPVPDALRGIAGPYVGPGGPRLGVRPTRPTRPTTRSRAEPRPPTRARRLRRRK
jgi:hypothetical protein